MKLNNMKSAEMCAHVADMFIFWTQVPLVCVVKCTFYAVICFHNVCMCLHVFSIQINVFVHFQHACMCVYVCVFSLSSGPSLLCVPHIRVLYTQHYVVVGAGVGVLPQQSSCLQQCRLACHCHVTCPPCLAVVTGQTDAHSIGAMPYQLLWPGGRGRHLVTAKIFK